MQERICVGLVVVCAILSVLALSPVSYGQDDNYPPEGAGSTAEARQLPVYSGGAPQPGSILVSSFFDDAVLLFDTDGNLLGIFTNGTAPIGPEGLVFRDNGNLLVVSRTTDSVLEYDGTSGTLVGTFVNEGLNLPHGMIRNDEGNLLIASSGEVVEFDGSSGALIGVFADIPGTLIDLNYGPNGNLFVSA